MTANTSAVPAQDILVLQAFAYQIMRKLQKLGQEQMILNQQLREAERQIEALTKKAPEKAEPAPLPVAPEDNH